MNYSFSKSFLVKLKKIYINKNFNIIEDLKYQTYIFLFVRSYIYPFSPPFLFQLQQVLDDFYLYDAKVLKLLCLKSFSNSGYNTTLIIYMFNIDKLVIFFLLKLKKKYL